MPSQLSSATSNISSGYRLAQRQNAFEQLTGEAAPSVLGTPSQSHRSSTSTRQRRPEVTHSMYAETVHPDDSISMVGVRRSEQPYPSRRPSTRQGYRQADDNTGRSESSRRRSDLQSSNLHPRDRTAGEEWRVDPFPHRDSVTGSMRYQGATTARDNLQLRLETMCLDDDDDDNDDEESEPETPRQAHYSARAPSLSRSYSTSSRPSTSQHGSTSKSSTRSRAHPPSSFRYPPQQFPPRSHHGSEVPSRSHSLSSSRTSGSTSKSSHQHERQDRHHHSSRSRSRADSHTRESPPPPEYRSQITRTTSQRHEPDRVSSLTRSASTATSSRSRTRPSYSRDGLRLGRSDDGRTQWERSVGARSSDTSRMRTRDGGREMPGWLLWVAGAI